MYKYKHIYLTRENETRETITKIEDETIKMKTPSCQAIFM